MIFVTLGTEKFPFDRLVMAIDKAVQTGALKEEVVIQSAVFNYTPSACETKNLLVHSEFIDYASKARCYVCHGGVGSIMSGLYLKMKPIVVPRYKEYGENIDNHQAEITVRLAQEGIIIPCYKDNSISEVILNSCSDAESHYFNQGKAILLDHLQRAIQAGRP